MRCRCAAIRCTRGARLPSLIDFPSRIAGGVSDDKTTILIIDDARGSREALVQMVEALGYAAVASDNPLEGLRLVGEVRPSLVLLDVVRPRVDGYKIAAAIKSQPRFVPVILLTALNDVESKR